MSKCYKSSKSLFARFATLVRPITSEWRNEAPEWINTALQEIGNGANLKEEIWTINVRDFRFRIPQGAKTIRCIYHDGTRLPLYRPGFTRWYQSDLQQPNFIKTSFQTDTVQVVITTLNLDEEGYPLIPITNTGDLDNYLFYYMIRNWLIMGNTHPVFKYEDVDQRIEGPVGRHDLGLRFAASNEMKYLSVDEMDVLRDSTVGLYQDYDRFSRDPDSADDLLVDPNYKY